MIKNYAVFTVILAVTLALIAGVIALLLPKRYTAVLQMLVDQRPLPQSRSLGVTNDLFTDAVDFGRPRSIATQVELVQSLAVMLRACSSVSERLGIPAGAGSPLDPITVQSRTTVMASTESDVITVEVEMPTKELASEVAQEIYLAYGEVVNENSRDAASRAVTRIESRLRDQEAQLKQTRDQLRDLRTNSRIPFFEAMGNAKVNIAASQEQALTESEAHLAAQTARLAALRSQRDALMRRINTNQTTAVNPSFRSLEDRLAALRVERQRLLERWLPESDDVRAVDIQISAVQAELRNLRRNEVVASNETINDNLQNLELEIARIAADVEGTRRRIDSLTLAKNTDDEGLLEFPKLQVDLSDLTLQANIQERNVAELSSVLNAALAMRDSGAIVTSLILPALAYPNPTFPNIPLLVAAGGIFGLLLGIIISVNYESRRRPIRSFAQLSALSGGDMIGLLPGGVDRKEISTHATEPSYSSALLPVGVEAERIAIIPVPAGVLTSSNVLGIIAGLKRRGVNIESDFDGGFQRLEKAFEEAVKLLKQGGDDELSIVRADQRVVHVRFFSNINNLLDEHSTGTYRPDQVLLLVRFGTSRSGETINTITQIRALGIPLGVTALGSRDFHLDVAELVSAPNQGNLN